jgi:hemoglobin
MKMVTADTQLGDIESQESVRFMVDSFYSDVRRDEFLGPIFEQVINDWEAHLPAMYQFWERLLFGSGNYQGNVFQKHMNLTVEKEHFSRWIELFNQTIDENFSGPKAEQAKKLARKIASTFQLRMGIIPDEVEHAISDYSQH